MLLITQLAVIYYRYLLICHLTINDLSCLSTYHWKLFLNHFAEFFFSSLFSSISFYVYTIDGKQHCNFKQEFKISFFSVVLCTTFRYYIPKIVFSNILCVESLFALHFRFANDIRHFFSSPYTHTHPTYGNFVSSFFSFWSFSVLFFVFNSRCDLSFRIVILFLLGIPCLQFIYFFVMMSRIGVCTVQVLL